MYLAILPLYFYGLFGLRNSRICVCDLGISCTAPRFRQTWFRWHRSISNMCGEECTKCSSTANWKGTRVRDLCWERKFVQRIAWLKSVGRSRWRRAPSQKCVKIFHVEKRRVIIRPSLCAGAQPLHLIKGRQIARVRALALESRRLFARKEITTLDTHSQDR